VQTIAFSICFHFYFQAEDGIRDRNVTGVQTCALPILCRICQVANEETIESDIQLADTAYGQGQLMISPIQITSIYSAIINGGDRSEERRVGKECGGRW